MEVLLMQLEKFQPLNELIIEDLSSKIKTRHYSKREVILSPPEVCENFYFVGKGLLRLFVEINGRQITTDFIDEGQITTIMKSHYEGNPSQHTIVAEQDSEVYVVSIKDFYTLMKKYQGFSEFVLRINEKKWIEMKERELKLLSLDSEQLYLDFVKENRALYSRIKGKDLSSYLNMTQETASRIKKKNNISKN